MLLQFSRLSLKQFNRQLDAFPPPLMKTFHAEGDENIHHVSEAFLMICVFLSFNPKAMKCLDSQCVTLTSLYEVICAMRKSIFHTWTIFCWRYTLKLYSCGENVDKNPWYQQCFVLFIIFTQSLQSVSLQLFPHTKSLQLKFNFRFF